MNDIKNVRVFATSRRERDGFNLYGDFSGQRIYLTRYRFNRNLYNYLKDGVSLEALRIKSRSRSDNRGEQALIHSIKQITRITEDFIQYEWMPEVLAG